MERLKGMYIPLPTPFTDTGAVDDDAVLALTDFYVEAGVHGLFVLGTFGQGPALTPDERKRTAKLVIDRVAGRIPVVIHAGTADTPTTIDLAKDARDKGADVVGVVPPYYFDHLDDEVLAHYVKVYEAIQYPMFIYNNAVNSGYRMTAPWTAKLVAEVPEACGIKMSFIPLEQQLAFVRALPSSCAVFSGSATLIMPGVLWGLAGSIHPLTVAIPELLVNLWDATTTGKMEEAVELQRRVIEFTAVIGDLQRTAGRSVLRESLKLRDLPVVDFPRWPTKDLNGEQATRLRNALAVARD